MTDVKHGTGDSPSAFKTKGDPMYSTGTTVFARNEPKLVHSNKMTSSSDKDKDMPDLASNNSKLEANS